MLIYPHVTPRSLGTDNAYRQTILDDDETTNNAQNKACRPWSFNERENPLPYRRMDAMHPH